ncbi:hypothetical protein OG579_17175 [Williamsia herbipolensis]|uniref:Uncharacterized protein n=1 Tax=Williamsia herbipolensis TaxID=1603258 RepID=A0AAU4K034_9NOCA|nr:hypothetical protein [Williamsia herbipolensis]
MIPGRLHLAVPRRGTWTPSLPVSARWALLGLWCAEPLTRGIDYLRGDSALLSVNLTVIEQAMPLWAWGLFHVLAASLLAVGLIQRWRRVAIAGLHPLGAIYTTQAIGLTYQTLQRRSLQFEEVETVMVGAVLVLIAAITWCAWRQTDAVRVLQYTGAIALAALFYELLLIDGIRTPVLFFVIGLCYWIAAIGYSDERRLVVAASART